MDNLPKELTPIENAYAPLKQEYPDSTKVTMVVKAYSQASNLQLKRDQLILNKWIEKAEGYLEDLRCEEGENAETTDYLRRKIQTLEWQVADLTKELASQKVWSEGFQTKCAELTKELEESERNFQQAFHNFKLERERAEKAEATSYLPMIPEGRLCLSCQVKTTDLCPWNKGKDYITFNQQGWQLKHPNCPKPYIEPKGDK